MPKERTMQMHRRFRHEMKRSKLLTKLRQPLKRRRFSYIYIYNCIVRSLIDRDSNDTKITCAVDFGRCQMPKSGHRSWFSSQRKVKNEGCSQTTFSRCQFSKTRLWMSDMFHVTETSSRGLSTRVGMKSHEKRMPGRRTSARTEI